MARKKTASGTGAFEPKAVYDIRVSRVYDSERFRKRFLPSRAYKVKGNVAVEIEAEGALASSELATPAADLNAQDL